MKTIILLLISVSAFSQTRNIYETKPIFKEYYENNIRQLQNELKEDQKKQVYYNDFIIKDRFGNDQTIFKQQNNRVIEMDRDLNIKSTYNSINGSIVKRDKNGKVIGEFRKDIRGNLIYYPR